MHPLAAIALYLLTALAEITGCYAIHATLRLGKPLWLLLPATLGLLLFAYLLTLHPGPAGRTYAAYGAIYIAASLAWMWIVENHPPDLFDTLGTTICLFGAAIIYFAPRASLNH